MRAKKSLIALDLMGKSSIILNKKIPLRAFDEKLVKFSLSGKNRTTIILKCSFKIFNETLKNSKI